MFIPKSIRVATQSQRSPATKNQAKTQAKFYTSRMSLMKQLTRSKMSNTISINMRKPVQTQEIISCGQETGKMSLNLTSLKSSDSE